MRGNTAIVLVVLILASCSVMSGGKITVSDCASSPAAEQAGKGE